jgi:hypothetical protein
MKKLYLSITLLGIIILMFMITLIPVQAYTFNGSYDFSDIDLDDSLSELNGATLNDLFDYEYLETIPLIEYNGFRNGYDLDNQNNVTFYEYVYIDLGYKNLWADVSNYSGIRGNYYVYSSSQTTLQIVSNDNTAPIIDYYDGIDLISNTTYTLRINSGSVPSQLRVKDKETDNLIAISYYTNTLVFNTSSYDTQIIFEIHLNDFAQGVAQTISNVQLEVGNTATQYVSYGTITEIYDVRTTPIENTDLVQSLYSYNLENLPINTIKYYFAVFLLNKYNLPVDDLWNQAFNAGESSGYQDGYDEGLLNGFNDGYNYGYNIGFDEGLISEVDTEYLLGFVSGTVDILGVSIIPGITLGVFVFIPLFLGFIGFIFRLGGRRG